MINHIGCILLKTAQKLGIYLIFSHELYVIPSIKCILFNYGYFGITLDGIGFIPNQDLFHEFVTS